MQLSKIIMRSLFIFLAGNALTATSLAASNTSAQAPVLPKNTSTGIFVALGGIPPVLGQAVIGYQFTPNWGMQVGVEGLWGITFLGVSTATIYDAALRGVLPLGNYFQLYGKIGFGLIHAQEDIVNPLTDDTDTFISESVGPTFGLGIGFCFSAHWMLSIEGNGIYSTGSSVIRDGFKALPLIAITYNFDENSNS